MCAYLNDSSLTDTERHYVAARHYATDDELRTVQAEAEFILNMAAVAGIEHSTDYLEALTAEYVAATLLLKERSQCGFEVIDKERGQFDRHTLDEIRGRFDLAAEIRRTVTLTKAGRNWRASCPFHQPDKTPSFIVYEDHFHCFGCGTHGDIFDWIQHVQGLTFPQAARLTAQRAGVMLSQISRPGVFDMYGRLHDVEVLTDVS